VSRRAILVAVVLALCLLGVPVVAGLLAGGPELRVMTWNVRTNEFDAPDWAPVVAERRPDVVAFQEICTGDAEQLADLLRAEHGLDYQVVVGPARPPLYETCPNPTGPLVFGQAVLSRVPVRDQVTTILPTVLPDGAGVGGIDEPRALLAVTLDLPEGPVRLLTTHITVGGWEGDTPEIITRRQALQAEQIATVARAAADSGERVVVLGDLNVEPGDRRLDPLTAAELLEVDRERNAPTGSNRPDAPGSAADRKLDYVFVKGLEPVGEPETFWVPSSDHRPLLTTLRP
jgi:endonuclease/exonuclease/phosphatase family metal-dependent hydrolase